MIQESIVPNLTKITSENGGERGPEDTTVLPNG